MAGIQQLRKDMHIRNNALDTKTTHKKKTHFMSTRTLLCRAWLSAIHFKNPYFRKASLKMSSRRFMMDGWHPTTAKGYETMRLTQYKLKKKTHFMRAFTLQCSMKESVMH